ncbi:hypothetical protein BDC45DRAFT_605948 [Circinella umbellata]|nr:hypothetical protein BDC45DRAFT_605948 [Circinella umbellata]
MEDYEMKLGDMRDEVGFQPDQKNEKLEVETDVTNTATTSASSLPEENNEKDLVYEDVTQYSYQPFPMKLPSQFLQPIPTDNKNNYNINTTPKFRKRTGRGGRVFIDRSIGHDTMSLSTPYRFDSDSDYYCEQANDDLMIEFEKMDDNRLLDYSAPALLSINDHSLSLQQPATTTTTTTTAPLSTELSSSSTSMEVLPSIQEH